jgi:hypothetical protein
MSYLNTTRVRFHRGGHARFCVHQRAGVAEQTYGQTKRKNSSAVAGLTWARPGHISFSHYQTLKRFEVLKTIQLNLTDEQETK